MSKRFTRKKLNHVEALQALTDGIDIEDENYFYRASTITCPNGVISYIVHIYAPDKLDYPPGRIVTLSDWSKLYAHTDAPFYKVPKQIDSREAASYLLDNQTIQMVNSGNVYSAPAMSCPYDGERIYVVQWAPGPNPKIICRIGEFAEQFSYAKFTVWED